MYGRLGLRLGSFKLHSGTSAEASGPLSLPCVGLIGQDLCFVDRYHTTGLSESLATILIFFFNNFFFLNFSNYRSRRETAADPDGRSPGPDVLRPGPRRPKETFSTCPHDHGNNSSNIPRQGAKHGRVLGYLRHPPFLSSSSMTKQRPEINK